MSVIAEEEDRLARWGKLHEKVNIVDNDEQDNFGSLSNSCSWRVLSRGKLECKALIHQPSNRLCDRTNCGVYQMIKNINMLKPN